MCVNMAAEFYNEINRHPATLIKSLLTSWCLSGDSLVATRASRGSHEGITCDLSKEGYQ